MASRTQRMQQIRRMAPGMASPAQILWALLLCLLPLLASLLFLVRLLPQPWIDGYSLPIMGVALVGLYGALALAPWPACRRRRFFFLSLVGSLGFATPCFALHLILLNRALLDQVTITLLPALVSLALFMSSLLVGLLMTLSQRPRLDEILPALLPLISFAIWMPALVWRPTGPVIWGSLALTFALTAIVWFAASLLRGSVVLAIEAVALATIWTAVLLFPHTTAPTGRLTGALLAGHLALAIMATALLLIAPVTLSLWRRLQASRSAAASSPLAGPPAAN